MSEKCQELSLITFHCVARRRTIWSSAGLRGSAPHVMRRVLVIVALLSVWDGRQAVAEPPVRIAYADVFPPFTELKDGKAEGLAVEIVRAAARHAGIEVEFVAVPFEQVQRTLDDGRAEAVFPLTITPERLLLFDFSDPILVTGGAFFVKAPNSTPQGLGSLAEKIVVTPRTGPLAAYIQRMYRSLSSLSLKTMRRALAALLKAKQTLRL